jgi:hypothetical protein
MEIQRTVGDAGISYSIKINFKIERSGNEIYVIEYKPGLPILRYGPIPSEELAQKLVAERKQVTIDMVRDAMRALLYPTEGRATPS